MKLFDGGIILIVVFLALGYVHYHKHHDGKFVDIQEQQK